MTATPKSPCDRVLPEQALPTGASPDFDQHNLPAALRSEHHLAKGCYGRLLVLAGSLAFVRGTANGEMTEQLSMGQQWVILPEEIHRVVLDPDARFRIEFFRLPTAGEGQA